jgi:hypothetical protein
MRSVYFEPGGVEIPKKFIPVLRGNALTITTTTDWRYVMLAGHCDRAESASPAGCLDAQRVAVKHFLTALWVAWRHSAGYDVKALR